MPVPDFQSIMLPLMKYMVDGKEHSVREMIELLGEHFYLSDGERKEMLPSGKQVLFDNRVAWTKSYLIKAGLLEATRRAHFQITPRGRDALASNPSVINIAYLRRYPEFVAFLSQKPDDATTSVIDNSLILDQRTPEELMDESYRRIHQELADELLTRLKIETPHFFEKTVVELLVKMGYGGSEKDAGKAVGKSGDGGIDGIIKEDRLGLDFIYIQAKRWEGAVGRPEIQKFVGALHGQKARRGVFITTSNFTKESIEYVKQIDNTVVLIDGELLANLMIDYNLGGFYQGHL